MKKLAVVAAIILSLVTSMVTVYAGTRETKVKIGSGIICGPVTLISVWMKGGTVTDSIGVYDTLDTSYPIEKLRFEMSTSSTAPAVPYIDAHETPFLEGVSVLTTHAEAVVGVTVDY